MDILRFITAGNVDDGKSTLIGRLLYETGAILDDQLEAIEKASRRTHTNEIDLAIITDGLKAEREQGITIDVAYKYFRTRVRKFIVADTPGHLEYTRNMITGASNTDLAIILIDATKGVTEQTVRHSYLVSLLNITHIVVCVNKMDAVGYQEEAYQTIKDDYYERLSSVLNNDVSFIPVSALKGENITKESDEMPWYTGVPLLDFLEKIEIKRPDSYRTRIPVQLVLRDAITPEGYRSYAAKVYGGAVHVGSEVKIYPSGSISRIKVLSGAEKKLENAVDGQSIVLETTDDVDISRGSLIVPIEDKVLFSKTVKAKICWMDQQPSSGSKAYVLQLHSYRTQVRLQEIVSVVDLQTLTDKPTDVLSKNDIGSVVLRSSADLAYDRFKDSRITGSAILIDPQTNSTVAMLLFDV